MTKKQIVLKQVLKLNLQKGDTYYQRYDHIKTYPFTLKDQNSVTDIVSFMMKLELILMVDMIEIEDKPVISI